MWLAEYIVPCIMRIIKELLERMSPTHDMVAGKEEIGYVNAVCWNSRYVI